MDAIWGMKSLGIDPSSGKEVFVRPDGTLTDRWSATDQVVIGDTEPTLSGNLGFGFEYKGFSVYFTVTSALTFFNNWPEAAAGRSSPHVRRGRLIKMSSAVSM